MKVIEAQNEYNHKDITSKKMKDKNRKIEFSLKKMRGPILTFTSLVIFIVFTQLEIAIPHIVGVFCVFIIYSILIEGKKSGIISFIISIVYIIYFSVSTYYVAGPGIDVNVYKIHFIVRVLNDIVLMGTIIFVGVIMERLTDNNTVWRKNIEQLERAEEFSHIMIFHESVDGKILKAPQQFYDFIGYTKQELSNMDFTDITHPDDLKKTYDKLQGLLSGEYQAFDMEKRYIKKNGQIIWVYVNISLVSDDDGASLYFLTYIKDITERKRAEEALKESEERYRMLVEHSIEGIAIYQEGRIVFINKAAAKIVGNNNPNQLIGKNILDYLPEEVHERTLKRIKKVEEKGEIEHFIEEEIIKEDNKIIYIEKVAMPFTYKGKPAVQVIGRDVTARKKSEENERLLREAKQYDELRNEFFANISHELRTPLNVILGTLQLEELHLKNCCENSKSSKKHVNIMKQNCNRLLRLVNNLIDITKIDAGFFRIRGKNVEIIRLIEEITLSVAGYVENKGIMLQFDTDIEEKIMVCDPDKIERIILNLLSNAVKFTDKGGNIKVTIADGEKSICIRVKDTGVGIPKAKQETIFERFRQVDKTLARNQEGSGIGLALVKSLVEMHNGKIHVESEYGVGSEFIIELPVQVLPEENHVFNDYDQWGSIERINIEFSDIYS